jgi:hypothetical protein
VTLGSGAGCFEQLVQALAQRRPRDCDGIDHVGLIAFTEGPQQRDGSPRERPPFGAARARWESSVEAWKRRSAERCAVALQEDGAAHGQQDEGQERAGSHPCVAPIESGVHFADGDDTCVFDDPHRNARVRVGGVG